MALSVLKFGGGCLHSADTIKKLPHILRTLKEESVNKESHFILVLSAFGKTTNMLEQKQYKKFIDFIFLIMKNLEFENIEISEVLGHYFPLLSFNSGKLAGYHFDHHSPLYNSYSRRVAIGEYVACDIINRYLIREKINNSLFDSSLCIWTEAMCREKNSAKFHSTSVPPFYKEILTFKSSNPGFSQSEVRITPGFIANDITFKSELFFDMITDPPEEKYNWPPIHIQRHFQQTTSSRYCCTTLGREGSDYTAAIIAKMLKANEVVLFKDVNGVYDQDPKKHSTATIFKKLSYTEAFKICNKTQTVIHPKTLLHLKSIIIPIRIRNFHDLTASGTIITH